MEFLQQYGDILSTLATIVNLICVGALYVYMHNTMQERGEKLKIRWYVCGYLFTLITFLVFRSKVKSLPGKNTIVCPSCGEACPDTYQICGRCLVPLPKKEETIIPEYSPKTTKTALVVFVCTYVITLVFGVAATVGIAGEIFSDYLGLDDYEMRIPVVDADGNKVFYDKMGNAYENEDDVILYGEDGSKYTYFETEDYDCFFVGEDGTKYEYYNCYVTAVDGWFYYDEDYELFCGEYECDEDYFDEEYSYDEEIYEFDLDDYRYYDYKYYDEEGNEYYYAGEASWNEKGELITAENDISA